MQMDKAGFYVIEPDDVLSYAKAYYLPENSSSICLNIGMINSKGLFFNNNPLDYSVPLILAQLSLSSTFILFTSHILRPLGQPRMVMHILGGLALGQSFLGRTPGFTSLVYPYQGFIILEALALFGNMFYFFLIGVQIDPWIFKSIERKDVVIGISTAVLPLALSIPASFISSSLKDNALSKPLIEVAIASSVLGFPTLAQYLTEMRMANSEFGRVTLLSSLISNLFCFCVMILAIFVSPKRHSNFMQTTVSGIGFVLFVAFVVRPIILWVLKKNHEGEPLKQSFIYIVFVGILVAGFISRTVGLNLFFGPLIYGMAIPAGPPLGSALTEKLDFITSWLFMPLYFVKTGLVTDVFAIEFRNYLIVQSVILVACIGKFLGAMLSSLYGGLPLKESIQIGLVVNVQGVLELGMFKLMKGRQSIDEDEFKVLCISMLIVTAGSTCILRHLHDPLKRRAFCKRRTMLDLRPDSELRVVACVHHQENVPAMIELLESLHPTKCSPIDVCLLHLVELVGRVHPLLIPHKLGKLNSTGAYTSKNIINAFQLLQQRYHGVITLHPFTAITPYASMHDEVCGMAMDRRASLVIVPFHRKVGIKMVNDNILQMVPCTTAIVVDRVSTIKSSPSTIGAAPSPHKNLFRVAVFFVGGPDDREALAIGSRMVALENTHLTIYRLILKNEAISIDILDSNTEKKLDNEVMSEIMLKTKIHTKRVSYIEEVVRDGTGTVALIRAIENEHETIIVGRRHDTRSPLLAGLSDWSEGGSELGTIGDMFALPDSNASCTILVIQNHTSPSFADQLTL